jgi:hypothetical protein
MTTHKKSRTAIRDSLLALKIEIWEAVLFPIGVSVILSYLL